VAINCGPKNLPHTFVIRVGGATAFRVGGSCIPQGAEMAQWVRY